MREPTELAPDKPKPVEKAGEPESAPARKGRRLNLDKISLIPPAGRKLNPTNEEIYDLIEFS
jgi:hypothetical protein